jgi:hypothetical protein
MEDLIRELIPHDPTVGLFVAPDIPPKKLEGALSDYAKKLRHTEVVALYDATLLGTGRDGAVFANDAFVFQNSNLEPAHEVKYTDLVGVRARRKLMGGQKIDLEVNRGRATIELALDFSGKPDAASYVTRFLEEAMHRVTTKEIEASRPQVETDSEAVEAALDSLMRQGRLTTKDRQTMLESIGILPS